MRPTLPLGAQAVQAGAETAETLLGGLGDSTPPLPSAPLEAGNPPALTARATPDARPAQEETDSAGREFPSSTMGISNCSKYGR